MNRSSAYLHLARGHVVNPARIPPETTINKNLLDCASRQDPPIKNASREDNLRSVCNLQPLLTVSSRDSASQRVLEQLSENTRNQGLPSSRLLIESEPPNAVDARAEALFISSRERNRLVALINARERAKGRITRGDGVEKRPQRGETAATMWESIRHRKKGAREREREERGWQQGRGSRRGSGMKILGGKQWIGVKERRTGLPGGVRNGC